MPEKNGGIKMNTNNMSSYRELKEGELLDVNDYIIVRSILGKRKYKVTRITKTLAICKYDRSTEKNPNDFIDIRFKRRYGFYFGFYPSDTWDKNDYKVYRKEE